MKARNVLLLGILAFAMASPLSALPLSNQIKQAGFTGNHADAIAYVGKIFDLPIMAEVIFIPREQTVFLKAS